MEVPAISLGISLVWILEKLGWLRLNLRRTLGIHDGKRRKVLFLVLRWRKETAFDKLQLVFSQMSGLDWGSR